MKRTKRALIFTLILLPVAAVGAYFAVQMSFSSLDPSVIDEAVSQVGSRELRRDRTS